MSAETLAAMVALLRGDGGVVALLLALLALVGWGGWRMGRRLLLASERRLLAESRAGEAAATAETVLWTHAHQQIEALQQRVDRQHGEYAAVLQELGAARADAQSALRRADDASERARRTAQDLQAERQRTVALTRRVMQLEHALAGHGLTVPAPLA